MRTIREIFGVLILTVGISRAPAEEHKGKNAAPVRVEDGGVFVSLEAQKKSGFEFAEIKPEQMAHQIAAFGTIVDPTPLLLLEAESRDAEAALAIASNQLQRAKILFQNDQTVSRRTLETAENQMRVENTRRQVALRRLALEWGAAIPASETNRTAFIEGVLAQKSALARIDLPIGQHLPATNMTIRVRKAGSDEWREGMFLGPAGAVDVRFQGESFFARVDDPGIGLRPGAAIEVRIADAGSSEKGWHIPAVGIVRYLGEHWIYVKGKPERFERKQVKLESRDDGGWFTKTEFEPGTFCVVAGAVSLLSAELQAAFGAEPE